MADVKGERVTPVKKPTIPASISKLVLVSGKLNHPDISEPMLAPALSAGANTPPDAPVVNEIIGPIMRSTGLYHVKYLSLVNNVRSISSLPDPIASASIK